MSFVSFPRTDLVEAGRSQTLYDKVYSAATNVFHSLKPDEEHPAAPLNSTGPVPPTPAHLQPAPVASAHPLPHPLPLQSQLGLPPDSITPRSSIRDAVNSSAASVASSTAVSTTVSTDASSTSAVPSIAINDVPQLFTTTRMAIGTSSMNFARPQRPIVSVSSEHAVPLLPSSIDDSMKSSPTHGSGELPSPLLAMPARGPQAGVRGRRASIDVDSLLSVTSTSASRAYLASQYSRSRTRAAPAKLSREFWMKDESATSCFSCNRRFTTFRRKHHCRVCGQIFCSACTNLVEADHSTTGHGTRVKCCKACEDAMALRSSSSDDEVDASFVSTALTTTDSPPRYHHSLHPNSRQETQQAIPQLDNNSTVGGNNSLVPLPTINHGPAGDLASEAAYENYSRFASPTPLDEMQYARWFLGSQHPVRARSRSLTQQSLIQQREDMTAGSLGNNTNNSSTFGLGLTGLPPVVAPTLDVSPVATVTGNTAHMDAPQALARFTNSASVELNNASRTYLLLFLQQLLRDSELDPEQWVTVLTAPLLEVASGLHLELNDNLSPREWVKVKRIPGGDPQDIDCICGSVFTHSLARRQMPLKIKSPRILLIAFPIEYARMERYMSLDPVVAQEKEYLRKLVARIAALKPTLLLTCSHVCGRAMGLLQEAGIAVAQHVRESALFRLSRITRTDILMSIDRLSTMPQIGTCELFEQRSYRYENSAKTFLFFFVKPADPGRCALVRGDPEISGVLKVVMEVMAEICYSLKAETALMRDQLVNVPNLPDSQPFILSSSPFVDYGIPYLQQQVNILEDRVVQLGNIDPETRIHTPSPEPEDKQKTDKGEEQKIKSKGSLNNEVSEEISEKLESETSVPKNGAAVPVNGAPPSQNVLEKPQFENHDDPGNESEKSVNSDPTLDMSPEDRVANYIRISKLKIARSKWLSVARLWDNVETSFPFMFNPSSHQNLMVLYSLVNADTATPCVGPELQLIEFYLNTDQTLGRFVETNISLADEVCTDGCDHKLITHYKKYVNGNGMVTVSVEPMPCRVLGLEYSILMWSYCKICEQSMPIAPMSSTTWKYSMGKYLELSFYGELLKMRASPCNHNIYRDHIRYFGWHGYALKIDYASIQLHEIEGPPELLSYDPEMEVSFKEKAYNEWLGKINRFGQSLIDSLSKVKVEGLEQDMTDLSQQKLIELKTKAEEDWKTTLDLLEKLNNESPPGDYVALNKVLETYQQQVDKWHSDLADFDGQFFPTERDIRRVTAQHIRGLLGEDTTDGKSKKQTMATQIASSPETQPSNAVVGVTPANIMATDIDQNVPMPQEKSVPGTDSNSDDNLPVTDAPLSVPVPSSPRNTTSSQRSMLAQSPPVRVKSRFGNDINLSMPGFSQTSATEGAGRVAILAKHFEELSQEFERERQREKQRLKERQRAIQMRHAHPVAEVFEDVSDAIEDWPQPSNNAGRGGGNSTRVSSLNGLPSMVPSKSGEEPTGSPETHESSPEALAKPPTEESKEDDDTKRAEPAKLSLIRTLANFWSERSSTRWNGIDYILNTSEHYFANSNIVLRESEPSSLIAFCLSLPDYLSRMHEFYVSTPGVQPGESFDSFDKGVLEQAMLRQTGTHMRYYFDRNTVKVSCKIFFSEQFDALRKKCTAQQKYIQSLSRCNTWDSTGGKSGSAFLKTWDDRLILKELTHGEFDSFVTFAPSYFEYMTQALFHDLPTVLAKLYGVYQITIRTSNKTQPTKMYVLVMENLFYGKKFSKFFDLKGSMRNRRVTETGKANEVLLDENMVEYIYESPVFVREHSKRMLRASLYNDTLFLTKMNVMDYSLVIGLDEENNVIVAGIIDYIRTYTWDKKIESWVKTRATTVGVKEPTVVSPKQYKGRFRESMERYFVMVPDCWSQPTN